MRCKKKCFKEDSGKYHAKSLLTQPWKQMSLVSWDTLSESKISNFIKNFMKMWEAPLLKFLQRCVSMDSTSSDSSFSLDSLCYFKFICIFKFLRTSYNHCILLMSPKLKLSHLNKKFLESLRTVFLYIIIRFCCINGGDYKFLIMPN